MNDGIKQTLVLGIQYDGTLYAGWQKQPNALAVQEVIENAILELTGINFSVIAAGRTDAGVHARNMITHTCMKSEITIPQDKIAIAINSLLPNDIRINFVRIIDGKFHARFDALKREYTYNLLTEYNVFQSRYAYFYKFPIDKEILFESGKIFVRKADFTTFSKHNPDLNNPICDVDICEWSAISNVHFQLRIRSNHFLYGMVRSLVGAMLDAARGKRAITELVEALLKCDRHLSSPLAPAQGLFFEKAYYPELFQDNLLKKQ